MPKPLAIWNTARDVWENPEPKPDRSCGHLDAYSATLPTSGMTANGVAYALPKWEHAIHDSASLSSALFGTPTARMWKGSGQPGSKSHDWLQAHGNVEAQVLLLPTVRTSDTNGPGKHGDGGLDLRTTVSLLPSPRATDGTKGGPNQRGSKGDLMLPSAVTQLPLLRTPCASEAGGGPLSPAMAEARGQTLRLTGQIIDLVNPGQLATPELLATPSAADATGGHVRRSGKRKDELLLNGQARELAGENMSRPSADGNSSADDQLPGQLSLTLEEDSA